MKKFWYLLSIVILLTITSNTTYGQTETETIGLSSWLIVIATWIIGGVTVTTLIVTSRKYAQQNKIALEQNKLLKSEHELGILLEIGRTLNDSGSIKAREIIYHAYVDKKDFRIPEIRPSVERVRAEFSQIAYWIKKGYLREELFLDMFSGSARRSWLALKEDIEKERVDRSSKNVNGVVQKEDYFMKPFEELAERARINREKQGLGEPEIRKL